MYDIALSTENHDLIIKDSDFILIGDAARVAQQIKIKLKFFLGEWFLRTTDGVPYLENILVKNPNLTHVRSIFRQQISSVDDVIAVNALNISLNSQKRELTVNFEAQTNYGLIVDKVVLGYSR